MADRSEIVPDTPTDEPSVMFVLATLALIAFTAFLVGPPAIGIMARLLGLPVALAALAPLGLVPLLLMAPAKPSRTASG